MSRKPLISVIIPVYNVVDYIPGLFQNLEAQDLNDVEVILVDDGSTDGSSEALESLTQLRDNYIYMHQTNQGVAAARNNALQNAHGQYLCFIDPDDRISSNYFSSIKSSIQNTESDLYIIPWRKIRIDGIDEKYPQAAQSSYDVKDVIKSILTTDTIMGSLWAKVFHRDLFKGITFPHQRTCSDFVPCVTAIANAHTVSLINNIYYDYTAARPSSLQNSQTDEDIIDSVRVHKQFQDLIRRRFPDLILYSEFDVRQSEIQACIHVCRSTKVHNKHALFNKFRNPLLHNWATNIKTYQSLSWKLIYMSIILGYIPTSILLTIRLIFANLKK